MSESNEKIEVDLSNYHNWLGWQNKIARLAWNTVYWTLFFPFPTFCFRRWRIFLLRCFRAQVDYRASVHNCCRIWAPWNLTIGKYSCLSAGVNCYNVGHIYIGVHTTISHRAFLCPGSHDFTDRAFPMTPSEMHIGNQVWIATEAFIGPRVHIGDGAVIGARACVFKDVEPWSIVGGNPASFIKKRELLK